MVPVSQGSWLVGEDRCVQKLSHYCGKEHVTMGVLRRNGFRALSREQFRLAEAVSGLITRRGHGTFLVIQWLRLHAFNADIPGSISGRGTGSQMPQLRLGTATFKKKKKHLFSKKLCI